MPELDPMKRWTLIWMVYATPLMTLTTDLGLSIRVSMFEHVDWCQWLGPLPRPPGMCEGRDWWRWPMGVIAKGIPRSCQGLFTSMSLGYPLSVFNKNSTINVCFGTSICVRSWCNWRASCVDSKTKQKNRKNQPGKLEILQLNQRWNCDHKPTLMLSPSCKGPYNWSQNCGKWYNYSTAPKRNLNMDRSALQIWCSGRICRMRGGLVHNIIIIPPALSLPLL